MPGRGRPRDDRARVLGPTWLPSKQRYRVTTVDPGANGGAGSRDDRHFQSEAEANEWIKVSERALKQLDDRTVASAIDAYEAFLKENGGMYAETIRRLRAFFPAAWLPLQRLTHELAKGYYEKFRQRLRPDGDPISVSYHRAALINARSLMTWCVDQGWIGANPFARVKGMGKKGKGKPQPTGDEARKLFAYCYARAVDGDEAALGILMLLLMALRSADVYRRVVRDVDLDATQLNVTGGKTAKSNEPREIPEILQPLLRKQSKERAGDEPLFWTPYRKDGHHTRRWLEQALEKACAAAKVPRFVPHALKGTAGTILAKRGAEGNLITEYLSHTDQAVTRGNYLKPGVLEQAETTRGMKVITGGRR